MGFTDQGGRNVQENKFEYSLIILCPSLFTDYNALRHIFHFLYNEVHDYQLKLNHLVRVICQDGGGSFIFTKANI